MKRVLIIAQLERNCHAQDNKIACLPTHSHRHGRAVTAAHIDQIWRPPRATYMHRFGCANQADLAQPRHTQQSHSVSELATPRGSSAWPLPGSVFGLLTVTRAVLLVMRELGSGKDIHVWFTG